MEEKDMQNYPKFRILLILYGIIMFLFTGFHAIAQEPPGEAVQIANEALQPFLDRISAAAMEQYGFTKDDNLNQANLGSAYKLYTITPEALFGFQESDTVSSVISKTDLWYFPVMIGNKMKAIFTVEFFDDEWRAVALGYARLTQDLAQVTKRYPKSAGYNLQLIRVYQANEFLFTVPEIDQYNLTSIVQNNVTFEGEPTQNKLKSGPTRKYSNLDNISTVIKKLQPIAKKNIEEYSKRDLVKGGK